MVELKSTQDTKQYMKDGIRYICENYKERGPGTKSERDAQEFLKGELEQWSDEVIMEDFKVSPHAFMGFISICVTLSFIAAGMFWFLPGSSLLAGLSSTAQIAIMAVPPVLMLFCLFMFLFEFLFYKEFVDFLFPTRISRNVYATRKPIGEVKRRIIFGGHTDGAWEWTFSLHGQLKTLAPVMGGSIIGMFAVFFVTLAYFISSLMAGEVAAYGDTGFQIAAIVLGVFSPFIFSMYFFINWRVIVDGANDNLTADYISMAVLKEMSDADFRFENTEVCCLLSGSEEAGLRGAKAFAKAHQKELQEIETVAITLDTMREIEQLQIYTRGCTGTIGDCEAVGDLLHEAGAAHGLDMKRADFYPGAVDAEAFSEYGVRACGFCGVNHDPKTYYHTRKDTWTNISEECINLSYEICLTAAKIYDEKGIRFYEDARTAAGKKNKAFPKAKMN